MQKHSLILGIFFVAAFFYSSLIAQESTGEYPFTGIINAKDTNLRAGSNLNYEVVSQLQKGDVVYVAAGWMDWLKVRCPANTLLWVSDGFIDQGLVTANKLNVRSGPDLKYNVICQAMKGDKVEVIKKREDGKWVAIAPPDNAFLWVSKQFVDKKGEAAVFDEHALRRDEVKRLFTEQETKYETAMKNEATVPVPYDELIAGFDNIAKNYADFAEEAALAAKRSEQLKSLKKKYEDKLAAQKKIETPIDNTSLSTIGTAEGTTKTSKTSDPVISTKKVESKEDGSAFKPRRVTAKGTLLLAESTNGQKVFKVIEQQRLLCAIKSKSVDLNQYIGKRVQIWGDEEFNSSWDVPLIEVNSIKVIKP